MDPSLSKRHVTAAAAESNWLFIAENERWYSVGYENPYLPKHKHTASLK